MKHSLRFLSYFLNSLTITLITYFGKSFEKSFNLSLTIFAISFLSKTSKVNFFDFNYSTSTKVASFFYKLS